MKVLVINPIMYTSETKNIKRAASIKDTMMYDFCLAFHEMGHSVTLVGGEPFKPTKSETYPFEVLWWECKCQKVCMPHCLPFMPETYWYVKQHRTEYDLIITSEVFSLNSLMAYRAAPDKTIIWHELAKHNAIMKRIPSKIWYGVIARLFMRNAKVVARSVEARNFVKKYCMNTDVNVIDHGVNLDKFKASTEKDNSFVVCSQLIERKKIDGILEKFAMYLDQYNSTFGNTILIGAAANTVMNVAFVYACGPLGAAIATSLSYMLIWVLRLYKVTRQMKLDISLIRDALSYVLLYLQATLLVFYSYNWSGYLIQIGFVVAVFVLYFKELTGVARKVLSRVKSR